MPALDDKGVRRRYPWNFMGSHGSEPWPAGPQGFYDCSISEPDGSIMLDCGLYACLIIQTSRPADPVQVIRVIGAQSVQPSARGGG